MVVDDSASVSVSASAIQPGLARRRHLGRPRFGSDVMMVPSFSHACRLPYSMQAALFKIGFQHYIVEIWVIVRRNVARPRQAFSSAKLRNIDIQVNVIRVIGD